MLQQFADEYRAWRTGARNGQLPWGIARLWLAMSVDIWLEGAFGS
jgi:hypothetical protein